MEKSLKIQNKEIFNHGIFGNLTTLLMEDGTLWFIGKEVCDKLGYSNSRKALADHCKHVTKRYIKLNQLDTFDTGVNTIPERDLYRLVMRSKLPEAEKFEEWVVADVLPTIRKTKVYALEVKENNNPLVVFGHNTATHKGALLALVESLDKIEADKPKVAYFDTLVERKLLTNIRDTAKEIKVPQNEFVKWLLDHKYVYRDIKEQLKPYAQHTPELFQLKEFVNQKNSKAGVQLLITPKGRETFNMLINNLISDDLDLSLFN